MKPSPNFVFIITDTQATNAIGAYGRPELHTPHIDRLAQTRIKFDNAYTTCPLCTPARASLFSGIYAHTAGPWTNNLPLGDNIKTMGQRFKDSGYSTAYIGKWHLDGHDYFGTGRCPDGWDPDFWYGCMKNATRFADLYGSGAPGEIHSVSNGKAISGLAQKTIMPQRCVTMTQDSRQKA